MEKNEHNGEDVQTDRANPPKSFKDEHVSFI